MCVGVIFTYVGNIKIAITVIFTCVSSCVTVCDVLERVPVCDFKSTSIAYSTSNVCMLFNVVMYAYLCTLEGSIAFDSIMMGIHVHS